MFLIGIGRQLEVLNYRGSRRLLKVIVVVVVVVEVGIFIRNKTISTTTTNGGSLSWRFRLNTVPESTGAAQVLNNGELLTLSLDQSSGAGFQSINEYLFAKVEMQLKLVPGNSAGTVTAFYLSSQGDSHDEIDFEFLGNVSDQPYTLHTNVFCQGKGNREQQFYLWFDPTADFHTYTILWNPQQIIFFVDGIAIREFKNLESSGIPFPKSQPMKVYSSLWEADDWATMGGRMKIDWSLAPFYASYRNFTANGCVGYSAECYTANNNGWLWQSLDYATRGQMKWVQDSFMIYDYCKDNNRFPQDLPLECYTNNDN